MRRRDVLAGLLLATALQHAQAQQAGKVMRIGYLAPAGNQRLLGAFKNGMRDLGYVEGRNLSIEHRVGDGRPERLDEVAAELVQLAPDVIVVAGRAAAVAAARATRTIPIVFAPVGDPVLSGLVSSLAQPGGNVTGVALYASELNQKRLEVLKEAVPGIRRVALLYNENNPNHSVFWRDTRSAGEALGLDLRLVLAKGISDLDAAFTAMEREKVDALVVPPDAEFDSGRQQIVGLAGERRLPTMYEHRAFVDAGGLMSYGPSIDRMSYRAAAYVDKILKGARPSDLPIEQPSIFELFINLNAAKALGLDIPQAILLRADEVIE
ncbi:MAG TPA: ABC transporter substrate-binding protein [Microvirga sp.]|nr:ABC transporter substrate-binding protein [Microvirga sp.]